ncbi:hypothetical protein B0T10DRAFT_496728 [Thelonectria olida]|uniref:Uncharacterized protein n=1 Tax=Thelonectria olida TaxID=1576542 RepID=A0A9P9AKG1_9HYPO|nr:hypothetical protein B0T10DRAFT_496728 [Thelonectria olida]
MPFYFVTVPAFMRPMPLIATPVLLTPPMLRVHYHVPPTLLLHPQLLTSPLKIHIIFHGTRRPNHDDGPFCTSTDISYHALPTREMLLANLSYFSSQQGIGDRVYSGQATLCLTTNESTWPLVMPGRGIETPGEALVRRIELRERMLQPEFAAIVEEARARQYRVFLVVDVDAREDFERQETEQDDNQQRQNGGNDSPEPEPEPEPEQEQEQEQEPESEPQA